MSDIRIDDDGFLVGDGEQERTEAENVLMREIKTDTTTIIGLMKGTQRLQRDALKAAQSAAKNKGNQSNNGNVSPRVNLQHPNRANGANNQSQRVNLQHPNRPPINNGSNGQQSDTARPRVQQNQGGNTGAPTPQNPSNDTARVNRQRDANGRFSGADNTDIGSESESAQRRGNRDSRGRFVGGDGSAAERSTVSRITDSLKDLNSNLTLNADTDRIDPMVDAIKEASGIVAVGIDASKKVLSVGNTLIAKPAMALGRGIKGLFKPKTDAINSPVAWYKRIWRTLERGNRQDQTQHAQEQRRLDELVRGQGQRGSADSGLLLMLGLGLAALLAAFKGIKIPTADDIKTAFVDAWDLLKQKGKEAVQALGTDNESIIDPMKLKKPTLPTMPQGYFSKAIDWASNTKAGKVLGWGVKKLPFISSAVEAGAGGFNAYNIDNDQTLTSEQKAQKQSENAGKTGGRIVGGLGGAVAGGKAAFLLSAPSANPFVIGGSVLTGSILGSIYGADALGYLGEKVGGGVYKNIHNTPTKKSKQFVEPSAYAEQGTEARRLYEKHRAKLDIDGSGIISRDEMIRGGRPDLLGEANFSKPTMPKGFTAEKAKRIKQTANKFGLNPNDLAATISFETGGTFSTNARNKKSSATGLIQFMGKGATRKNGFNDGTYYGMTRDQFGALSFDAQMDYVDKFLEEKGIGKNGKTSLSDIYGAVLGYNHKAGTPAYDLNPNLDVNENGIIEKGEAVTSKAFAPHRKKQFFAQANTVAPKITPTSKVTTSAVPTIKTAPVNAASSPGVQSVPSVQAQESPRRLDNTPTPIKVSMPKPLVGQNVNDRGIAHIVTGGIGETV